MIGEDDLDGIKKILRGLGHVLMVGRDVADIRQVVAVMIVIIVLGLLVDKLVFERLEKNMRHKWGLDRV